jgi:membrane peptidoglycan carboxypeptidase
MRRGDRSVLANGVSLIICGLLAGVVVAAAAFPAVALTGLAAKAGADNFDSLPSVLQVPQAPQVTNVYASDGKTLITSLFDENRRNVPIDQISQVMQDAVVASEDKRFFLHNGVDVRGIARAFVADSNNKAQQGASTLTMQYVRLATSYSATTPQQVLDATADSPARKLREAHLAIALEKQLTDEHGGDKHAAKLDILDRYLNIAPFGHGAYGIYAAAEVYFNEPPKALTLAQSSLIAGLLQGTTEFDPSTTQGRANAVDRRNLHVLPEMQSMGFITPAQEAAAIKAPAGLNLHPTPNGCISAKASYGFFCDYLYRWWLNQPAFGADQFERQNQLETGGYKIVTTLNVADQAAAVKHIQKFDKTGNSSAMMISAVEPKTGYVDVVAVNRNYNNDETHNGPDTNPKAPKGSLGSYPNTTIPLVTGSPYNLGYQFGSTFKMFTMIAALESGLPLSYKINTTYQYKSNFPDKLDPNACNGFYCPTNSNKNEKGPYNMWTGYGHSVNTYFVPLEDRIGTAGPIDVARRLGITISPTLHINNPATFGAFTLGVIPVTPLQMASAYGTVANNGVYCTPLPVKSITNSTGHQLDIAKPQCTQAVPADIAHLALDAARCPIGDQSQLGQCNGAHTAGVVRGQVGRPIAGKTGTTDNNQTYALIAMTPQLAVAGVVADPDFATKRQTLPRPAVNTVVALTLRDAMKGQPVENFPPPDPNLAFGKTVSIPNVKCASVSTARTMLQDAGFSVVVQQAEVASSCKQGSVAMTDPTGSTVKGGPVAIYISNGKAAPSPSGTPVPPGPPGPPGRGGGNGGGGPPPPLPTP